MLVVSQVELEPFIKTTAGIHSHKHNEQVYIVLEGNATMYLNGTEHDVKSGMVIFISPGEKHSMISTGKMGSSLLMLEQSLNKT